MWGLLRLPGVMQRGRSLVASKGPARLHGDGHCGDSRGWLERGRGSLVPAVDRPSPQPQHGRICAEVGTGTGLPGGRGQGGQDWGVGRGCGPGGRSGAPTSPLSPRGDGGGGGEAGGPEAAPGALLYLQIVEDEEECLS